MVYVRRDRLTRDPVQGFVIEKLLRDDGCEVHDLSGVGNGGSPADEMIRGIMDVVNKYERAVTSMRTKAILAAKKARGERIGGVPYGFKSVGGKLHLDEDEQRVIEVVASLRNDMELTYDEVIVQLDIDGITNRRGNPFSKSSLCEMMKAHNKREEEYWNGILAL